MIPTKRKSLLSFARAIPTALGHFWAFPVSSLVTDTLLAATVFLLGSNYWIERTMTMAGLATMVAFIVGGNILALCYSHRAMASRRGVLASATAACLLAIAAYATTRGNLGTEVISRPFFAALAVAFALVQVIRHGGWRRTFPAGRRPTFEPLRWSLLIVALLALHRPLLTAGTIGAGDSYWYRIMAADFVTQFRAGIFPVFTGQSLFAFNGAVSPIRLAPALQHLAGLLDLVTLHSLTINALVNLTLFASYLGGGAGCYLCLRRIGPSSPWFALLLSLLYCGCPGVLALAYTGDLYMSVTTLPFIPLVLYGAWRTLHQGDRTGVLIMVAGAAALWYCHPPIAFWCTLIAAITQLGRLVHEWRRAGLWLDWLIGAATFGVLTLYCFVSVWSLRLPAPTTPRPVLLENLKLAYPAALKPVSDAAVGLGDYQLGLALWAALVAGLLGLFYARPRRPAVTLVLATLAVLAVLLPIPGVYDKFWLTAPQFVSDVTFMWPMQRLYAILAALAAFVSFVALAPFAVRHPRWAAMPFLLLLTGAGWSGLESLKFQRRGLAGTTKPVQARNQMRPQNVILTRYAFNPFKEMPPYFSHGYIDPLVPNRLLDRTSLAEIASNRAALDEGPSLGPVIAEGTVKMNTQPPLAGFTLQPGRRYALRIEFVTPDILAAMTMSGPRLYRLYWLPHSGYNTVTTSPSRAFGTLPEQTKTITLWTDGDVAEAITFQFVPNEKALPDPLPVLARYQIREYEVAKLPVTVQGLTPYRALITTSTPAYLETPRIFTGGYQATVNGAKTSVVKSPDALVMIAVPAGPSTVVLSFPGPWYLRAAFWASFAGWLVILFAGFRRGVPALAEADTGQPGHL